MQACEAETLLIAAFLGFGSLADTAALIAKVCFVLSLIFAIMSFLKRGYLLLCDIKKAGITPVTVPIKTASKRE